MVNLIVTGTQYTNSTHKLTAYPTHASQFKLLVVLIFNTFLFLKEWKQFTNNNSKQNLTLWDKLQLWNLLSAMQTMQNRIPGSSFSERIVVVMESIVKWAAATLISQKESTHCDEWCACKPNVQFEWAYCESSARAAAIILRVHLQYAMHGYRTGQPISLPLHSTALQTVLFFFYMYNPNHLILLGLSSLTEIPVVCVTYFSNRGECFGQRHQLNS